MKYCVNYDTPDLLPYLEQFQEIKFTFKRTDNTFLDFLQKFSAKSLLINLENDTNENDFKLFRAISKQYPNIIYTCWHEATHIWRALQQYELPFFFNNKAADIDVVNQYYWDGARDIYISNALAFQLLSIHKAYPAINIRVLPDIAQTRAAIISTDIDAFFIRPEDIHYYENIVSTFEFAHEKTKQHVMLEIYKSGVWRGKLNEIILYLNSDIDNRAILEIFGEVRLNCGKKCLKGNTCRICSEIYNLSNTLIKSGNVFQISKNT